MIFNVLDCHKTQWDGVNMPVQLKKSCYRNLPPASIFALGLRSENSLKNHILYQKWPIVNVVLVLILQNIE